MYKDLKADIAEIRKQVESDKTYLDAEFSKQVAALSEKIEGIDPVDYAAISADIERIKKSIPAPVVNTENIDVSDLVSKSDFINGLDRIETRLNDIEKSSPQDKIMEVAITNLEQLKDALEAGKRPSDTQTVVTSARYPFRASGQQAPIDLVRTPSGGYAMPVANIDGTSVSGGAGGDVTISGIITTSGITSTPIYDLKNISPDTDPEISTYKYYGSVRRGGSDWRIMRKTIATKSFAYASGGSGYSTAWTGRTGLTYT
jgi:hypothetical protein